MDGCRGMATLNTHFPDYTSPFQNTPLATLIDKEAWLSELEDISSPRPDIDDLWLDGNTNPQEIIRTPIIILKKETLPLPFDVIVFLGGIGFCFLKDITCSPQYLLNNCAHINQMGILYSVWIYLR